MYCHAFDPAFAVFISDPDSDHADDMAYDEASDGELHADHGHDMDLALLGVSSLILGAFGLGILL